MSLVTKMQVTDGKGAVRAGAAKAQRQARQAGRQARQAASQVAPLASGARVTARHGVHSARSWAAPRLDRTGQVLQDRVAPRMSAMLSAAARRIEPSQEKRRRWPFLTAGLVGAAAAAAAAARMLMRRGDGSLTHMGKTSGDETADTQSESPPPAQAADVNGRLPTS